MLEYEAYCSELLNWLYALQGATAKQLLDAFPLEVGLWGSRHNIAKLLAGDLDRRLSIRYTNHASSRIRDCGYH